MARTTIIKLLDDLDGSEAAETVQFGLDGVLFEIDLSEVHAKELRELFAPYIDAGRKQTGRSHRVISSAATSRAESRKIREWARQHGRSLGDRGRIPNDIVAEYRAAA